MANQDPNPQFERLSPGKAWWMAVRPHTLPAAIAPVIVAWSITIQQDAFLPLPALAALVCALLLQIISNLVNDVMDFSRGADTDRRLGFQRVTQSGLLSPRAVWRGTALAIGLTVAAGAYLVWLRGPWVLLLGLLSIAFALAYSAGPFPLSYNGLGDPFVLLFFGFGGLCGTVFVIMGRVPPLSWVMAFNIGALITAILVVNNIRDVEEDRAAGRRNLPVVLGLGAAYWEYRLLLILPYLLLILSAAWTRQPGLLTPLLSVPLALRLIIDLPQKSGASLNPLLGRTAQLVLLYGLLLAGGFLLI